MSIFFDYTSGRWIDRIDADTAMDTEGNLFFLGGDRLVWDPDHEEFHDTSGWDTDDE